MYQVIKEYIQSQNKDYISKRINIKDHNMFILSDRRHIYTINLGSGEKISIKTESLTNSVIQEIQLNQSDSNF